MSLKKKLVICIEFVLVRQNSDPDYSFASPGRTTSESHHLQIYQQQRSMHLSFDCEP